MSDIGAKLREARMRQHLDIAEFEARTKIRAKYLRALEDEEWVVLPGHTFTKAFLRTYADMLGLDGRMLVDEFKRIHPDPAELEFAPSPTRHSSSGGRERQGERGARQGPSGRMLAIALLILLIAVAIFAVHELTNGNGIPAATNTTQTTHSTTPAKHSHTPPVSSIDHVALKITATTAVRVCLVGYTTHGTRHQRLPASGSATKTQLLAAGSATPVLHAERDFLVSFSGGSARLSANGHSVSVDAAVATVVYRVTRSHAAVVPATSAPHCT
ncbi:MAG TPA: helix-turn-helix domain-containing protein [Solirubrobacteraceae bacterium]|jgi:cytoskeletal protein RodZ|nr:helix-turn-helix domain-containing protein [Solirubrobacteraceae bacterium]